MTPFEQWFSSDFNRELKEGVPDDRSVLSSGQSILHSSWDRKAAYLLWQARGCPAAAWTKVYPIAQPAPSLEDLLA